MSLNAFDVTRLSPLEIGFIVLVAGFGSLAPDIDHHASIISKRLPHELSNIAEKAMVRGAILCWLLFLFSSAVLGKEATWDTVLGVYQEVKHFFLIAIYFSLLSVVLSVLSYVIRSYSGHRGITHSYFFAASATLVFFVFGHVFDYSTLYTCAFGWGWITHLVLDVVTPAGLPYLWWHPFSKKRY